MFILAFLFSGKISSPLYKMLINATNVFYKFPKNKNLRKDIQKQQMKFTILTTVLIITLAITTTTNAQVGIGVSTADINPSAQLDVTSSTKGFLPPRMTTTERDAISTPATGLVIFNTTTNSLEYKSSTEWVSLKTATPNTADIILPNVLICTQQWMENNLDVSTYRNGDPIPYVADATEWASLTTGAWCYYNNDPANGNLYGKLYNWYAVNDTRGLAPMGWHVPTDAEWTTLTSNLGGTSIAGGRMKLAGTTWWTSPNTGATNSSGFTGLAGGYRNYDGAFYDIGIDGHFWSSYGNINEAKSRLLSYNRSWLRIESAESVKGYSVRCIKD